MDRQDSEQIYTLHLTKRQAQLLSYACDQYSRLICGQDWSYRELMEEAWEKRCKEAVGGHGMDKEWDGGWYKMRHDAEALCEQMKKRFWGLESNAMYGVYYDDTADILFDIHCVIRHQLWKDRPDSEKSRSTVDAFEATRFGSEPLARMERRLMNKYGGFLFSNGTECMEWQSRNCEKCVKAVFYDEKKDRWPKYRCAVQKHIEEAAVTDGRGNKRDYEATHSYDCPFKQTERKARSARKDNSQEELF